MKISKLRDWLNTNKVFFETISATLLGLMAIIISILSINVTERQLENEIKLNQPLIKISNDVFSYYGGEKDSRFLIIENIGGPLQKYNSEIYNILEIETRGNANRDNYTRKKIQIPLNDYFSGTIGSYNYSGTIEKYIGINNYNLLSNLDYNFEAKYGNEYPQTFINIKTILIITFEDYRGEMNRKAFEVDELHGGREIILDNSLLKNISIWSAQKREYIYKLRADDIKQIIENNES